MRLLSWYLALQEYNIKITNVKGKLNVVADMLSRAN